MCNDQLTPFLHPQSSLRSLLSPFSSSVFFLPALIFSSSFRSSSSLFSLSTPFCSHVCSFTASSDVFSSYFHIVSCFVFVVFNLFVFICFPFIFFSSPLFSSPVLSALFLSSPLFSLATLLSSSHDLTFSIRFLLFLDSSSPCILALRRQGQYE